MSREPRQGAEAAPRMILFDPVLRRPGCVLLQAVAGCSWDVAMRFPSETWLVAPTPDMRVFEATPDQLDRLVVMARAATEPAGSATKE